MVDPMEYDELFAPSDPTLRRLARSMLDVERARIAPSEGEVRAQAILGTKGLDDEPQASDPYWEDLVRVHVARLREAIASVQTNPRCSDEQRDALVALARADLALALTRGSGVLPHRDNLRIAYLRVIGGTLTLDQARAIALLARAAAEWARDPTRSF